MIIWNGKGYIIAIIFIVSAICMQLLIETIGGQKGLYAESMYGIPLAFLVAAGITELVARKFGFKPQKDTEEGFVSNQSKQSKPVHSLFFIPFRFWSIIFAVLAVAVFVGKLF